MKVYIITDPELGWDCIVNAYTNKEKAEEALSKLEFSRNGDYCIHETEVI